MDRIVKIASGATDSPKHDDSFIDRLNNRYTVIILVVAALIVTTRMWVGSPITCWAPRHMVPAHIKYTTSYCWVKNTYYLPFDEPIPKAHEDDKRQVVPYYQWIPFILLGMAMFFYLPSLVWNGLNQKAGVDADNILVSAQSFTNLDTEKTRQRKMKLIVNQFNRFLGNKANKYYQGFQWDLKHIFTNICRCCSPKLGNYLVLLYIFSKILYIVNVIAQLFILNSVLATDFNVYGFQVFDYWVSGKDWTQSPGVAFPRVTFCDFNIRRLGNIHRYTVQCTLPINMYNEKIFMFMWFWMVFLAVVNCLDLVQWLSRYFMYEDKIVYLFNHLRMLDKIDKGTIERHKVEAFYNKALRQDGVFLLRLIGHSTDNIIVSDITGALWERWHEILAKQKEKQEDEIDHGIEMSEKEKLPV